MQLEKEDNVPVYMRENKNTRHMLQLKKICIAKEVKNIK